MNLFYVNIYETRLSIHKGYGSHPTITVRVVLLQIVVYKWVNGIACDSKGTSDGNQRFAVIPEYFEDLVVYPSLESFRTTVVYIFLVTET